MYFKKVLGVLVLAYLVLVCGMAGLNLDHGCNFFLTFFLTVIIFNYRPAVTCIFPRSVILCAPTKRIRAQRGSLSVILDSLSVILDI